MWSPTSEGAAAKNSERNHSDGDVENLKEVDAPQDSNPCLRFCTVYRNAEMSRPSRQVLPRYAVDLTRDKAGLLGIQHDVDQREFRVLARTLPSSALECRIAATSCGCRSNSGPGYCA